MITVSIVIPAYNEERRLPATLERTIEYLDIQQYESEILVVNDGSTDKTKEVTELFSSKFPNLVYVEYFPNRGKGYAVKTGMLKARGKYRLFMDADYAVPIEFLTEFLKLMDDENKIIIGSRGKKDSIIEVHQSFFRERLARFFGVIQRLILGIPYRDTQCGFKLFSQKTAEKLFNQITYDCSYFDAEMIYIAHKLKIPIIEIPVKWKHDMETRMPIGIYRSIDLLIKLFKIKKIHKLKAENL
jgi:dolichyl-phosphate beta-glucosyltransferase